MADDVSNKLKQELKDLPENWIVMLETSAENSLKMGIEAVKILTQKGLFAIVLSASRPCSNLLQLYKKNKIDINKIFILCCLCKSGGGPAKDINNVIHLQSVAALTEISVALNEVTKKFKGNSFFFLDSITSMLIHNPPKTLAAFVHSILVKMRLNNVNGILLAIEPETNKEIRAELIQLCDKVIKV